MDLGRFRNYSLWVAIISLIPLVLQGFGINVLPENYSQIITTVLAILVIMGIINNPTTQNKGYAEDIVLCSNCGEKTKHVMVNSQSTCTICGNVNSNDTIQ